MNEMNMEKCDNAWEMKWVNITIIKTWNQVQMDGTMYIYADKKNSLYNTYKIGEFAAELIDVRIFLNEFIKFAAHILNVIA